MLDLHSSEELLSTLKADDVLNFFFMSS